MGWVTSRLSRGSIPGGKGVRFDRRRVWVKLLIKTLRKRDGDSCGKCGKRIKVWKGREPDAVTIDHVVPSSLGGGDDVVNLRLAHNRCNANGADQGVKVGRHKGFKQPEWVKAKMSKSHQGVSLSKSHLAAMKAGWTQEKREKQSIALTGNKNATGTKWTQAMIKKSRRWH